MRKQCTEMEASIHCPIAKTIENWHLHSVVQTTLMAYNKYTPQRSGSISCGDVILAW